MKALEEKILTEGTVLPGGILKVGSFLNQQIDTAFLMEMGREIAGLYRSDAPTKILTLEASGIALAVAAGVSLDIPVVFAKKSVTSNVSGKVYQSKVHSYTHGNDYHATVAASYLLPTDRVLLIDDFLANGAALCGLRDLVNQAGAICVGAAIAIEKGFQGGGDALRKEGFRVESLAIVDAMSDDSIVFRS